MKKKSPNQQPKPDIKNPAPIRSIKKALVVFAALLVAPSVMAVDMAVLTDADRSFVKTEAANGKSVLKIAQLGMQKSDSMDLKAFAKEIIADQTGRNKELAEFAKTKGVELSAVIDPETAEAFQNLEKLDDSEFDRAFLANITDARKAGIDSYSKTSRDTKSIELKSWVDANLPNLKASLAKASQVDSK